MLLRYICLDSCHLALESFDGTTFHPRLYLSPTIGIELGISQRRRPWPHRVDLFLKPESLGSKTETCLEGNDNPDGFTTSRRKHYDVTMFSLKFIEHFI